MDTELQQLEKMAAQPGGLNPVQQQRYNQLKQQSGASSGLSSSTATTDPMAFVQAAQQAQVQANQPAISTLNTAKTDLQGRYKDLLDSIMKAEQPALDTATAQANAGNAARGIAPNSELAIKNVSGIQNPIAAQFGQLTASTGVNQQTDLNQLAGQIAGLQAGNVPGALTFGGGLTASQNSLQAAIAAANAQVSAAQAKPFTNFPAGGFVINQQTGQLGT